MNKCIVAETILQQLGGNQFVRLTGSYEFRASDDALTMRLRRNKSRLNTLTIKLEPDDTYTMVFYHQNRLGGVKTVRGVYCDMLKDIFEDVTGLYVTLFAR